MLLFPGQHKYFIRQDVFICYTDIGFIFIFFIWCQMRFLFTGCYINLQHCFSVYLPTGSFKRDLRTGVHFRSSLYHIIFFFTSDAGYIAVVFHSYQQPTAIGIGKSRQGAGYLFTVAHLELKIELLMLALFNQCFYRMFLLHFGILFDRQN